MPTEAVLGNLTISSELPQAHGDFDITRADLLRALAEAEESHAWFRARNEYIAARLGELKVLPPARVIDLGCGGGVVLRHLAESGYRMTGVEGHRALAIRAAERTLAAEVVLHDLRNGPPRASLGRNAVAGLFDVVEHLEDPLAMFDIALACVAPGGFVVGTAPALMGLWSGADIESGHRTRFSRRRLAELLARVPRSEIVAVDYFNSTTVPLQWARRHVRGGAAGASRVPGDLAVPPPVLNFALLRLIRAEAAARRRVRVPWLPGAGLWFCVRRTDA